MSYDICVLRPDELKKFLMKLDNDARPRLVRDIDFLKEYGSRLSMPYTKKLIKNFGN